MKFTRLFAAACVAAFIMAMSLSGAGAHSNPVRFDPAPGSVLDAAPGSVTGWFTSDLRREAGSFLRVLNQQGDRVDGGETELSSDRRRMSVPLTSGLGPGRYLVHWSTHDDGDGEVFSACYIFFVGQEAAAEALAAGLAIDGGADCPAEEGHDHGDGEGEHDPEDGPRDMANAPSISLHLPEVVESGEVMLEIEASNFTPRAPDGSTIDPNFGHYHIYLDKVPLDVLSGEHGHVGEGHENSEAETEPDDPNGLAENPIMWFENGYQFSNLQPGLHTVTVVLNHDDHTSLDPPVIASRTFRVADEDGDGVPVWSLLVTGGIGVAGLVVGGYSLLTRRS